MKNGTTPEVEMAAFSRNLEELLRSRIRTAIEAAVEEELTDALGAVKAARKTTRRGSRNGTEERSMTTEAGTKRLLIPRGRVHRPHGSAKEFESRCQRRFRFGQKRRLRFDTFIGRRHGVLAGSPPCLLPSFEHQARPAVLA
ncbi:MAG: transposase [Acidobacteriota bacterium]|nr:MAG: transposase [Acidobacteriota bacterium]